MSQVITEAKKAVTEEIEENGFISIDFETMRELLPYSDRESLDGLGEELSMDNGFYYEVDDENRLVHFAQFEMQLTRARERGSVSEVV